MRMLIATLLASTTVYAANVHVVTDTDGTPAGVNDVNSLQVYIVDQDGDTANVTDHGLDVFIQDQHTPIVDLQMFTDGATTTFAKTQTVGDNRGLLSPGHGVSAGDHITFWEGNMWAESEVLVVDVDAETDSILFDSPFDFAWTTSAVVQPGDHDMNQNGAVTPIIAYIGPEFLQDGESWDIVRVMISITDNDAMDDGTFGGETALTNGIVMRVLTDGVYHTLFNAKTNSDLASRAYDLTYASKPPSGTGHGLRWRRTFGGPSKTGVTIRLNSVTNDRLEIVIQDDLTGLATFRAVVQGHVVD